ncbi:glycosyl hydrolase [Porcipelethomonas ammoniilytica]|uniref:glycosyl hydrolase n=1 Tax=Porcipelethomonas ammoniilytica TaxID=2981722 RepID=UPI000820FD67|nr:glycosyl hydrolase [Porcipelethomonas ammoniilytica]MCU6719621.1 glycosyl hydrolase [Porcipelethomonas ammoniilytica]SCI86538.1 Mannan endo-1%2C4-beta-mannosidase [uncultured Ruminococcus sp.]
MKNKFLRKIMAAAVAAACTANVSLISNLVTADTSTKYEFEDGVINGTSMEITEDSSASGGQYVYMKDAGETVTVTVDVEETGMYDLAICYHLPQTMGSDKVQKLNVNGVNQGQIGFVMNDGFEELDIGMYKLNAGQNEIQLESFWGWTYFDYLTVKSADMPDLNVAKTLSDKKATDQTKRLMSYLVDNYGEHIISGQQEIYKYGPHDFEYEFEYIKNLTGVYPAIRGFDYLNECNILYGSEDGTTDRMIDWAKNKNGIITASWHVTVPKNFASYNVGDKVDYSQATYSVKDDNGNYVSDFDTSKAIIEGEKEYEYYMACLETLAASIKRLQDENIPIILRPLHEAEGGGGEEGSWFWWGKSGSAVYKELWKLTYKTLTEDYGLHNIIWEWNSYAYSTSANWYPGDEYVDIVAYDKYNCTDWSTGQAVIKHNDSAISGTFYNLVNMYNGKKMVAMAENDSIPTLENLTSEKAGWLYFCPWYDGGSDNNNFLSNPQFNKAEDLIEMYQSDYCISLDEIPADLYNTYSLEGFDEETTQPTTEATTTPVETTPIETTPAETTPVETTPVTVTTSVTTPGPVWSVIEDNYTLNIGDTQQIKYYSGIGYATFTSEDTDIVVVDENGIMTAISEGSTRIKLECHDFNNGSIILSPLYVEVTVKAAEGGDITVPTDVDATLYGDVSFDGIVDSTDIVVINKLLLSSVQYPLENATCYVNADCDNDQIITTKDSIFIINYTLNKISLDQLGLNSEILK